MIGPLCIELEDNRKGKAKEVLFCPVCDEIQLKDFITTLKKLEGHNDIDCFFLYRKGMRIDPESGVFDGLSVLHAEERFPLGSSGAFFAGTYTLFHEGYDVIVIADTDAVPASKNLLHILLQKARALRKVVVPFNNPKENIAPAKTYVINQWGAFPRSAFAKAGFYTPYMWRGGEDYDLMLRLRNVGLLLPLNETFIYHPRPGYTIFHKMAEKKKFYPYAAGLMKVFLFHSGHDLGTAAKFLVWFVFYAFFGDVFSDKDIFMMLSNCNRFTTEYNFSNFSVKTEIKKVKERAAFPSSFIDKISKEPKILLSLLLTKKAEVYTDEIHLKISRIELLTGIIKGVSLLPYRFAQACLALMGWKQERKKVVYPVKPENAKEAIEVYKRLITEKNL